MNDEDGSGLTLGAVGLVVTAVLLVIALDLGAYVHGAVRARSAADAGALAAVTVADPRIRVGGDPREAARVVVVANRARLLSYTRRRSLVTVEVDVRVKTLLVGRFAGRRIRATATATAVRPATRRPTRDLP